MAEDRCKAMVGVPSEGTECRFKLCEWKAGGSVFGEGV